MLPFATVKPEQIVPYASLVEWTGVHRLWQGQSITVEPHQGFSHLAGTGMRIPLGMGVTLMPLRHPFEAAVQASSLARLTGQPLTVGYGPGGKQFQSMLLGEPYRSPLTAVREYVDILQGLLAGRAVDVRGEYFSCNGSLPGGPTPRVEVALGVLRAKMARLAGEVAGAAVTWLTPASYLRDTVTPAMTAGAEGRAITPRLVTIVPLAIASPNRNPAEIALASNAAHLRGPHYASMLAGAGIDISGARTPLDAAQRLVEGRAFLSGDIDTLLASLKEFEEAGVNEIVLNLTGVYNKFGPAKAMAEMKLLLGAIGIL
jgi:alkanesulfonate monooxygenase SsuD/methylene tetrahydromethanopterin reductase-like flavin-dependent oxidoreductase (luciferase family)